MSAGEVAGPVWLTGRLSLHRTNPDDIDDVLRLLQDPLTTLHNPSDALTDRDQAAALVEAIHRGDRDGIPAARVAQHERQGRPARLLPLTRSVNVSSTTRARPPDGRGVDRHASHPLDARDPPPREVVRMGCTPT